MPQQNEIIEGNKLIARFIGYEYNIQHEYDYYINHFYHSSWDWLMPVVEKINTDGRMVTINFYSDANTTECKVYNWGLGDPTQEFECESAICSVWNTVVQFIKWYNQNLCKTPSKPH